MPSSCGMKALILGAGYGTRLQKAVSNDKSGTYQHLDGVPKPLLPIGKKPLISHWTSVFRNIPDVDEVYVATNGSNHEAFQKWHRDWPEVKLFCDGTLTNETRSGAVPCIQLVVQHFNIQDDLIVIAGDTLFLDDFKLTDIISQYQQFKRKEKEASLLVYTICSDEEVSRYGILELNENQQVVNFREKPAPTETTSRKACPCFYIINKYSIPCLDDYLEKMKDMPLKAKDAPGNFISYLQKNKPVYAVEVSGRFDVGSLPSYALCHQHFLNKYSF